LTVCIAAAILENYAGGSRMAPIVMTVRVAPRCFGVAASCAAIGAAIIFSPSPSAASFVDLGAEGGVLKRSLSDVDYKTGFVWQLHGELTFFPFLMMGPYATFASSTPQIASSDSASSIDFRTIGLRVKLKIPVSDSFAPYGVVGAGWAHATFPDQVIKFCEPPLPACIQKTVPSATANFAEFLVGAGVMWNFASPLALTGEFDWRPTVGYKNDVYERQIQTKELSAPDPGRNGVAWVGLFGLAVSF
jgi:opacity protein-like surface antigen